MHHLEIETSGLGGRTNPSKNTYFEGISAIAQLLQTKNIHSNKRKYFKFYMSVYCICAYVCVTYGNIFFSSKMSHIEDSIYTKTKWTPLTN